MEDISVTWIAAIFLLQLLIYFTVTGRLQTIWGRMNAVQEWKRRVSEGLYLIVGLFITCFIYATVRLGLYIMSLRQHITLRFLLLTSVGLLCYLWFRSNNSQEVSSDSDFVAE